MENYCSSGKVELIDSDRLQLFHKRHRRLEFHPGIVAIEIAILLADPVVVRMSEKITETVSTDTSGRSTLAKRPLTGARMQ